MRKWLRNKWVKIGLAVLVVLLVAAIVGMAWDGGKNSQKDQQKTETTVTLPPPVPPKDYSKEFEELKGMVANLNKPGNSTQQSQPPQPVNVTVNPPVVNITVTQTVNGIETGGQSSSQTVPSYLYGISFTELKGLVYAGNFNTYKGTIEESSIDHNWGSGGPFGLTRFSIKWRGSVVVEESGRYRFTVFADDLVRLDVGGEVVINKWTSGQSATEYTAEVDLAAGAHQIVLKYFNDIVGDSRIKLVCQKVY